MVALLRVALVIAVLFVASPAVSSALVPYDDFSGFAIDPDKWSGFETESGADGEIGRRLESIVGALRMNLTSYGGTTSNSGRPQGTNGLNFPRPNDVTAIQAGMTFLEASAPGCPANSTSSRARMNIVGDFFNDGSGDPATGDRTGNFRISLQKVLDSNTGRIIEANIGRCLNASCSSQANLANHTFTTKWKPFLADTLRLEWEPWNNQFVFTVNPGGRQERVALHYSVAEVEPAVFPFKIIAVSPSGANCTTGGRRKATADGLFDNVMTNPLP